MCRPVRDRRERSWLGRRLALWQCFCLEWTNDRRYLEGERRARPGARARGREGSAMLFGDPAAESQAQSQAAVLSGCRNAPLLEDVEDAWQDLGRDPNAGID